jgi:hypothetical protein
MSGMLPHVITFQNYATVLTENCEYEQAIDICNQSIDTGWMIIQNLDSKSG